MIVVAEVSLISLVWIAVWHVLLGSVVMTQHSSLVMAPAHKINIVHVVDRQNCVVQVLSIAETLEHLEVHVKNVLLDINVVKAQTQSNVGKVNIVPLVPPMTLVTNHLLIVRMVFVVPEVILKRFVQWVVYVMAVP